MSPIICNLINKSLTSGICPKSSKVARVDPIFKGSIINPKLVIIDSFPFS